MRGFSVQRMAARLSAAALCLCVSVPAWGLVLHPEDELPPPVRPLDAAVGRWVSNASCVPIAPGYVITTRHQHYDSPGRSVWIDGVEYETAELFNHSEADLRVVRITTPEGQDADLAYYIAPYTGTDERHETVVIGGYGKGRGDPLTTPGGVTYGYTWSGAANDTLRWGANRVDGTTQLASSDYTTALLTADFDGPTSAGHIAHEAAPAAWDSGGGWFIDITGTGDWRVAGLTRGVEHGPPIGQSWFRDSVTGMRDPDYLDAVRVSSYAGWINGITHPSVWNVDASGNWADPANWSAGVPDAASTWAVLGDVISADRLVTLDAPVTLGTLRIDDGDRYTVQGTGSLTFEADGNPAGIEVNRQMMPGFHGAHTIGVPITLVSPLVIRTRSSGDLTLAGALSGPETVTKRGEGTLVLAAANHLAGGLTVEEGTVRFGATQHLAGLDVAGGVAQVATGTGSAVVTGALDIDESDSRLDLADGAMILDYTGSSAMPQVSYWLHTGLNWGAGHWEGNGIISSAAAADPEGLRAVGVLDNMDPAQGGRETFLGEEVDPTSILARYTWWGDTDLNGVVNSNDYDRIDGAWLLWTEEGLVPEGGFRWGVGDFNYDGTVNSNDYDLIDRAWLAQGAPLSAGVAPPDVPLLPPQMDTVSNLPPAYGTVPDPATVALLGLGTLILTVGRRCAGGSGRRAGDG